MDQNSTKKRTKREHIISRFYLKNFSLNEKVWVVDFHSDKEPYLTNINNVLCINDYFTIKTGDNRKDDQFERNLSVIENEVKPIIDNLLNKMIIPEGKEKQKLLGYLACLFLLGPRTRQVQLELIESAHNFFLKFYFSNENNFDKLYREHKTKHPESKIEKEIARRIVNSTEVEANMPRVEYIRDFLNSLPAVEIIFNEMIIKVLWANPQLKQRFITGDFPFVIYDKSTKKYGMPDNGGLLNKNIQVFIPISPLVCILLEYNGESRVNAIRTVFFIPLINSQLACSVSRYIISSTKEIYWLKKNTIYDSASKLHREFYPNKLNEPMIRDSTDREVIARRDWNKLKGY